MTEVVLEVQEVSKSFPGVQALDHVNLELRRHEILGLVGENGAGKSTLLKILVGLYTADSGEMILRGQSIQPRSVKEAGEHGVAMVFQEHSLLPNLTVRENIFLGNEEPFLRWGVINWKKMSEEAEKQLAKVGSPVSAGAYTADLTFAERQMVEIAKVMALEERVRQEPIMILDEPTSVLYKEEVEQFFEKLLRLKERASIIFVSHRLEEILEVTDRVYVLKDGRNVASMDTRETNIAELHRLMVGRELKGEYYREGDQIAYRDEVVLSVVDLSKAGAFYDVTFDLHRGEILGLCGVLGSGREALCRCLFGADTPDSGEIRVDGQQLIAKSPTSAIDLGIGYVPMERRTEGLLLYLSVAPNITLASLEEVTSMGFLNLGLETEMAKSWIKRLNIRTPSHRALCLNLSGGNQQKVVLAKWLASRVNVLILDHPTRGLDVGAKEEVYELIRQLAKQGIAIILVADTLEETIGLSNTILAMKDGHVQKRFEAPPEKKPQPVDLIQHMM
ncbi:MAG: sugar ABC transporter ATP-binding protein [Anaerolineae bacterium]